MQFGELDAVLVRQRISLGERDEQRVAAKRLGHEACTVCGHRRKREISALVHQELGNVSAEHLA